MRYAIWAAVSKKKQAAKDKSSLPNHIKRSRQLARSRGWKETAGPFVVPGESRTQYIDITIAERYIPQLKEMLDSAEGGEFDVLICHDLTRFRNLVELEPVETAPGMDDDSMIKPQDKPAQDVPAQMKEKITVDELGE